MMRFIIAFILSFLSFAVSAQTTQILGAPNTRIATKGDMSVDSILYLPRTLVTSRTPTQAGALRYQASDSALYQWTGTAWRKAGGGDVDTLLLSTRAWRQKGIDSLASVRIGGSGVTGYIPKFTTARTLDSSQIFQLGGNIGIGTALPSLVTTGRRSLVIRGTTTEILMQPSSVSDGATTGVALVQGGNNFSFLNRLGGSFNFVNSGPADTTTLTVNAFGANVTGTLQNDKAANFATASGSVGIGTTSPISKLQVSGSVRNSDSAFFALSSGNVGIGTAQPTLVTTGRKSLVIRGSTAELLLQPSDIADGQITGQAIVAGGNDLSIVNRRSGDLNYFIGSDNKFKIFANSRVGINTTTDAGFQFDVNGTARLNGTTIIGSSVPGLTESSSVFGIAGTHHFTSQTTKGISRFNWVNNAAGDTVSMGVRLQLGSYNGYTANMNVAPFIGSYLENISTGHSGLAFGTSAGSQQERMRIFSNGRVAINTTTDDGYQFMVNGTALISGTVNGVFTNQIRNTGQTGATNLVGLNFATYDGSAVSAGTFLGEYANSWTYISSTFANSSFISGSKANGLSLAATNANGYMRFFTGGNTDGIPTNERMRIKSDGEVLINTTSDAGAFSLQVNGVAYAADGLRTGNPTGGTAATWKLGIVVAGSYTAASNYLQVDVGGTLYYIGLVTPN